MRNKIFFGASAIVLFMGFFNNTWKVAPSELFYSQNRDMEAHVLARLMVSRQFGLGYAAGLTGQGAAIVGSSPTALQPIDVFSLYVNNGRPDFFIPYLSHSGGQAFILSLLDRCLPVANLQKLHFYHGLVAMLSALIIAMMLLWIRDVAGSWAGWSALLGTVLSAWLTVFGRNLWWCVGVFYLPFLTMAFALKYRKDQYRALFFAALIGLLMKCLLTGYEYITPAGVMLFVPLLYQGIADGWTRKMTLKAWGAVAIGAVVALFLSAIVLCLQISVVSGSFQQGMNYLIFALEKRTSLGPHSFSAEIMQSRIAPLGTVLADYVTGSYVWSVAYWHVLVLFGAGSALLCARRPTRQEKAYIWATGFALLAPLSWLVIFKAHAVLHLHMDFIVWQMPLTLLGFGVVGRAIEPRSQPH